ncbi:hypothetical protein [Bradyrhizobium japonicum]|uniref:hypothetical protein n=1 Tax=Bradyrhizobium japonicum TaxID=375 RepID=UPI0035184669
MKTQVRSLAIALAIAVPIGIAATAESSAAPINGTSMKAAALAVTTDVHYPVRRSHPHHPYPGYPTYNSYWGYPAYDSYRDHPTYGSYWEYPTYNSYYRAYDYGFNRSGCLPGPRVGAFATAPWTDTPTCPPY